MPNTATADLDDFVTLDQLAEEYPDSYPLSTLRYLARREIRESTGFADCLRRVTPRHLVISRSRFARWIEGRMT